MVRDCSTGKRCFDSRIIAEEALRSVRSYHGYGENEGPLGVYQCDICHCFHFTSRDTGTSPGRGNMDKEARYWEDKLKNR